MLAKIAAFVRNPSDPIALGEALARVATYARSVTDPLTLGEAIIKSLGLSKAVADPLVLGEAVAKALVILKAVSDGLELGRGPRQGSGLQPGAGGSTHDGGRHDQDDGLSTSLSDPLVLQEALAKVATFRSSLADPILLGDTAASSLAGAGIKTVTDPIVLGENLAKVATYLRSLSDALSLGEAVLKSLVIPIAKADPIALTDVINIVVIPVGPVEPPGERPPGVAGMPRGRGYWPSKEFEREEEKRLLALRDEEENVILTVLLNFTEETD